MSVDYDWLGSFARGEETPTDDPLLKERLRAYQVRQQDVRISEAERRREEAEKRRELYEAQHHLRAQRELRANSPEAKAERERVIRYREEALAWRKQNAMFNQQWKQDHRTRLQSTRRWRFFGGASHKAARWLADTHRKMAAVPTPGGLAGIVGAIVLLLLFIVPVNSSKETRAQLAFDVLRGAKEVDAGTPPASAGDVFLEPLNQVAGSAPPTSTQAPSAPQTFTPGINMPLLPGVFQ